MRVRREVAGAFHRALALAFACLNLAACDPSYFGDGSDSGEEAVRKQATIFLLTPSFVWGTPVLTDMGDGTIRRTQPSTHRSLVLSLPGPILIVFFKKCAQGQTFRSAQNDCQGTGNAGNNWGVQALQFCPTNDASCEQNRLADASKSPAAASCAGDSTAGRSWIMAVPSPDVARAVFGDMTLYPEAVIPPTSLMPELPSGTSLFWTPAAGASASVAYYVQYQSTGFFTSRPKNEANYVVCMSRER